MKNKKKPAPKIKKVVRKSVADELAAVFKLARKYKFETIKATNIPKDYNE